MLQDFLLGVGVTLIIISLVLIGGFDSLFVEENSLNKDEIINQARGFGMYFPGEKSEGEISLDRNITLTIKDKQAVEDRSQNKTKLKTSLEAKKKNKLLSPDNKVEETKSTTSPIVIKIPAGISSREVADLLVEKELIEDKNNFIRLLAKFNLENKIMAGSYKFSPEESTIDLLLTLTAE